MDSKNSFYRIIQIINDNKYINDIYTSTDEITIKNIVKCLVGKVLVYFYNENNSYDDLTEKLGCLTGTEKLDFSKIYIVKVSKYTAIQSIPNNNHGTEFLLKNLVVKSEKDIPNTIKCANTIMKLRSRYYISNYQFSTDSPNNSELDRRNSAGDVYEKFVAKKYIEQGFNIIYNGIENNYMDNGIDLIASRDNKFILIQCKNWKLSQYSQIKDKELRVFFGDCFKYILDNELLNRSIGFHYIISDERSMDKSALNYLKRNNQIKYKCVAMSY